jgi:hypothetical protein
MLNRRPAYCVGGGGETLCGAGCVAEPAGAVEARPRRCGPAETAARGPFAAAERLSRVCRPAKGPISLKDRFANMPFGRSRNEPPGTDTSR